MATDFLAWLTVISKPQSLTPTMKPGRITVTSRLLFNKNCSVFQRSRSHTPGASGAAPKEVM